LRTIFGRFRDADLKRAFETARPIQCSDLVMARASGAKWHGLIAPASSRGLTLNTMKRHVLVVCATHQIDRVTEAV
jgi:hypothetical protein